MRKIIVYCDRCGKETSRCFHLNAAMERLEEGDEVSAPGLSALHGIDLCWDCVVLAQKCITGYDVADPAREASEIEVDKSSEVDSETEEPEDEEDAPGADDDEPTKGKLAVVPNEFLRSLVETGVSVEKIRGMVAESYGVTCSTQTIRNRLRRMGL